MGQSFSHWLIISEVFRLDQGRVLTLAEALDSPDRHTQTAQQRLAAVQSIPNYQSGPHRADHIEAAVVGLKPAAIVRYDHHPDNPAAAIVSDAAKKPGSSEAKIQAELLRCQSSP